MYHPPSPEESADALDARMDAMLRDFFQAETPAVLPLSSVEAPDDWSALAPLESTATGRKWDIAAPAVLVAAAVLVVCGILAFPKLGLNERAAAPKPVETIAATPAVWTPDIVGLPKSPTRVQSTSEWRETNRGRLAYTVTDGDSLVDLKYYTTSVGAIEQRTNIEWTTVRVYEPESGEWLQATVPSVRVDVVRIGQ
jgi:hypothetical protein